MLGAGAEALVALSVLLVDLTRLDLAANRTLQPDKVHIGSASKVELRVRNEGKRKSPVLVATDRVECESRTNSFFIPGLPAAAEAAASYRVPARRRGVHRIGPFRVQIRDPLGLAAKTAAAVAPDKLTVYPSVQRVSALPGLLGGDPDTGSDTPTYLGRLGENYCALRPYEDGDDLRRVHWPSTARMGQLMIRQEEMPWDGRTTVLVDLRRPMHDNTSLEEAISAAASITAASIRHHNPVRVVTTEGIDTGFGVSSAHGSLMLERLAQSRSSSAGSLVTALSKVATRGGTGALVVLTTSSAPAVDLHRVAGLCVRYPILVAVVMERTSGLARRSSAAPKGITTIHVSTDRPFAASWGSAIQRDPGATR